VCSPVWETNGRCRILDGDGWLTGGQQLGTTKLPATWASRGMSEARDGRGAQEERVDGLTGGGKKGNVLNLGRRRTA
jgi:hypothetical protein